VRAEKKRLSGELTKAKQEPALKKQRCDHTCSNKTDHTTKIAPAGGCENRGEHKRKEGQAVKDAKAKEPKHNTPSETTRKLDTATTKVAVLETRLQREQEAVVEATEQVETLKRKKTKYKSKSKRLKTQVDRLGSELASCKEEAGESEIKCATELANTKKEGEEWKAKCATLWESCNLKLEQSRSQLVHTQMMALQQQSMQHRFTDHMDLHSSDSATSGNQFGLAKPDGL
jgi:chromosome segregation ATPase